MSNQRTHRGATITLMEGVFTNAQAKINYPNDDVGYVHAGSRIGALQKAKNRIDARYDAGHFDEQPEKR